MKSKRIFAFLMAVAMMLTVFSGLSVFAENESVSFVAERDGDKFVINFVANEQISFGGLQLNGHTTYDTEVFTYTGLSSTVLDCTQGVNPMADQGNAMLVTVDPGTTFLTINYTVDTEKFEAGKEYSFDIDIDSAYTNEYEEMSWGGKLYTLVYSEEAPATHTVTFVDYDGTVIDTQTVEHGAAATAPTDPTREGYTFTGWDKDFSNVTEDITVTAQYRINSYQLKIYYIKDTTYGALQNPVIVTLEYGAEYSYASPASIDWDGQTWLLKDEDQAVISGTMPAHDVEIDVLYYLYVAPTYTVTFVDWNGAVIDTQVVSEGEAATAPTDPTREGYTFTGWDKDFSNVTEDITVTALYTINTYTVTWVIDDVTETQTYEYGAMPTHADPTKEGDAQYSYTFAGWTPEVTTVTGNATYTATWNQTINTYTVYFVDWNGTNISTQVVEYGADATAPADPVREGYIFIGWDKEFTNITGDLIVYAQYEYEPIAPTVEAETVELRERATADGKSDIRFIFKVTFNDSYVVEGEDNYGPTEEYYKITRLYVEMVRSDNSTPRTLECKNLYTVSDDSFEFTVVIKNIPATGNDVVFTMTPYIDYTYNGVNGTATNTPIESSVNMVGQND